MEDVFYLWLKNGLGFSRGGLFLDGGHGGIYGLCCGAGGGGGGVRN